MELVDKRFLELAQNKDISDEDLQEELCYIYAKQCCGVLGSVGSIKYLRESETGETKRKDILFSCCHSKNMDQFSVSNYSLEKYEMKKRIQTLEQTLATFMEQTRKEHLAQEATIQSLSKEMDEFQEEFYDCQSDLKEHVGLLEDALQEAVENVLELHHLRDHLKYKMA